MGAPVFNQNKHCCWHSNLLLLQALLSLPRPRHLPGGGLLCDPVDAVFMLCMLRWFASAFVLRLFTLVCFCLYLRMFALVFFCLPLLCSGGSIWRRCETGRELRIGFRGLA